MLFHAFPKLGNSLFCRFCARNALQGVFPWETEGLGMGEELADLVALGFAEGVEGQDGINKFG